MLLSWIFRFEISSRIGSGDRDGAIAGLLSNLSLEGLEPQWMRPLPPRLPILDGEVASLKSGYSFVFEEFLLMTTFFVLFFCLELSYRWCG